jgi:hypothetical protein
MLLSEYTYSRRCADRLPKRVTKQSPGKRPFAGCTKGEPAAVLFRQISDGAQPLLS